MPSFTRTPSMKTSGWFDRLIEEAPRMRICVAVPFVPDCELSATPGTRDCSRLATFVTGASLMMSAAVTEATSADCALRSWLPAVPVTTTSDRLMADVDISKLRLVVVPAVTVAVCVTDL